MAVDEPQVISISIGGGKPQVGHLHQEATMVNCPACERFEMSVVQSEAVTCLQRLLSLTKLCKSWRGRVDINHYCGHCGCYIGRYVPLNCYERCISKRARQLAVVDEMRLKTKPKDCAVRAQKCRENVLEKRAAKRAKAEERAKQAEQTQTQTALLTTTTQATAPAKQQ